MDRKNLVFVATPWLLPVVFQALKNYPDYGQLIPGTIGLIGFDLDGWTRLTTPAVSATLISAYQEGMKAAQELIDMIDGKSDKAEVVFKSAVKWRETTL